jgi:nucleotide-binding universal stress UspA family protein
MTGTTRIDRVLCPIDFSETSRHAVEQAATIAGWYRAQLTVLHVYSPVFMPIPMLPAPADRVADAELQRVHDDLTAFLTPTRIAGVAVDQVVDVGHPAASILARAARSPADLIVLGTHGAGGVEHVLLGSVTEKVLRKATCPVLTVPPRARATSRLPFRRIVCAVDFSEWSCAALELATSLARESDAVLDLVHVLEWPWDEPPPPVFTELPPEQAAALIEFRRYLVTSATNRLESAASEAAGDRSAAKVHILHGKPYVQLLRVAAGLGADLIVLGVHGRNPIDLAMFGSTTNQIVRRATCPVLTLRR